MARTNPTHVRTQTHFLINKILEFGAAAETKNGKSGQSISPFMLVLDSLEMPAMVGLNGDGLVGEICARVKQSGTSTRIIFISFETLRPPTDVDSMLRAHNTIGSLDAILRLAKDIQLNITEAVKEGANKIILILDTLHPLASISHSNPNFSLPGYLTSLLAPPPSNLNVAVNLAAIYHTSLPRPTVFSHSSTGGPMSFNPYAPDSLTLLLHLATTVLVLHSLPQVLEKRVARSKALAEPGFGMAEGLEGVLQGLGSCGGSTNVAKKNRGQRKKLETPQGVVVEMQHRRRSGRGVLSSFVLGKPTASTIPRSTSDAWSTITLLRDHASYQAASGFDSTSGEESGAASSQDGEVETTFNLGLTEKQRRDRESVVLPYYDAQRSGLSEIAGGMSIDDRAAEGGRILYDMGVEDDFDEEEDEI